jgi:hypothetical protein
MADLLDDDLFPGAYKTRALLAYSIQRSVELFRSLDAVREVAAKIHGNDTFTIYDFP